MKTIISGAAIGFLIGGWTGAAVGVVIGALAVEERTELGRSA